jgi:23S rRNA (cytidine1920-2'-O)/16S rRNA (cytidine1409-2'-O)-methyltransferase
MVKPQFEVGRERVGKGGVVRDPELRRAAVSSVAVCGEALGCSVQGVAPSGLPGPKGNLETFAWLAEGSRGGADWRAALAEVAV